MPSETTPPAATATTGNTEESTAVIAAVAKIEAAKKAKAKRMKSPTKRKPQYKRKPPRSGEVPRYALGLLLHGSSALAVAAGPAWRLISHTHRAHVLRSERGRAAHLQRCGHVQQVQQNQQEQQHGRSVAQKKPPLAGRFGFAAIIAICR